MSGLDPMLDPADPKIHLWHHLTGEDFRTMDRANTVVLVPCSPLEVHGPHLPTMADIRHADGLIERTADILSGLHPEIGLVRLPWMWTAADVLPHVGSIKLKASTVALALS